MDAISYKCPSCGAGLSFDSESQKMFCKSCKNKYDIDELKDYYGFDKKGESSFSWNTYDIDSGNGDWSEDELNKLQVDTCPSCGAEIITDQTTASTECLYCGNPTIINKRLSGVYRPDYVIPFKVEKDEARNKIEKFCKGKPLLPSLFKQNYSLEKVTGVYVPFWLFNCDADAKIMYNAKRFTYWSDSKYDYTKTDYYSLIREGNAYFENLPVDASTKVEAKFMEGIEPFDCSEKIDFNTAYLSGFLADKYDISADESQKRANQRVEKSMQQELLNTTCGYSQVTVGASSVNVEKGKTLYALLPVWLLSLKYKDKIYKLAVNGQTGKFVGELPVSKAKFTTWLLSLTVGMSAVASLVLFFMGR